MKTYLSTEIYKEFGKKDRRIARDIMIARLLYYAEKCPDCKELQRHIIHGYIEDIKFNDEKKTFQFITTPLNQWNPTWW